MSKRVGTYSTIQEDEVAVLGDGVRGGRKERRRTRLKCCVGVTVGVVLVLFFLGVLVLVVSLSAVAAASGPGGSECALEATQRFTCFPDINGASFNTCTIEHYCTVEYISMLVSSSIAM